MRPVKVLFTWTAIAAMAYTVWRSREFLAAAWSEASGPDLITAVLVWASTHLVLPLAAMLVLGRDRPISYGTALAVHALRLPAKYLPGGIWHMVGRMSDFRTLGHERPALFDFILLENLVAAAFALGVGAALLAYAGVTRFGVALSLLSAAAMAGLLALPWALRLVTRSGRNFPWPRYAQLLCVTTVFWLLATAAFVSFIGAFGADQATTSFAALGGTYLFSWGAGFVAFFAPQGIGVFEFVSGKLLEGQLPLGHVVALMAVFRVVMLAGDLVAWSLTFAWHCRAAAT